MKDKAKYFLGAVIAVWIFGALLMQIYYGYERKIDCIKNEGWLKGVFWCKTDSMTSIGLAATETEHFFRGLAWPIKLFMKFTSQNKSDWAPISNAAPHTIATTAVSQSKEADFLPILLVFFNASNKCRPEIGLMGFSSRELGSPIERDMTSKSLMFSAAGFQTEKYQSVFTRYTGGFDYAFHLDDALLHELKNRKEVDVKATDMNRFFRFSLTGFAELSDKEYHSCLGNS